VQPSAAIFFRNVALRAKSLPIPGLEDSGSTKNKYDLGVQEMDKYEKHYSKTIYPGLPYHPYF